MSNFMVGDLVRCADGVTIHQLEEIEINDGAAEAIIELNGIVVQASSVDCLVEFQDSRYSFYLSHDMLTYAEDGIKKGIMDDTRDYLEVISALGM